MSKGKVYWNNMDCEPIAISNDDEIETIFFDYIDGFESRGGKHILGFPDYLTIQYNGDDKRVLPSLLYLIKPYSAEKKAFDIENVQKFGEILNGVCGYSENTQKVQLRLDVGICNPLAELPKKEINNFITCKIKIYVLNNLFKIGGLSKKIQEKIGAFIVSTYTHDILIIDDKCTMSCAEYIKRVNLKKTSQKKMVGYNINTGLVKALKKLSEKNNTSLTHEVRTALLSDRWGQVGSADTEK